MSSRVGNQDNLVRPQECSLPCNRNRGLALQPESNDGRSFLNWGERLRARNEHLAVSQGWIGERDEVGEIVNRGCLDSVGLTKRLWGFVDGLSRLSAS